MRDSDASVIYFHGHPLAIFDLRQVTPLGGVPDGETVLTYLTTDHLGSPLLASDASGATVERRP